MNSFKIQQLPVTEKWNSVTHAAGVLFAIIFIPQMITDAYHLNNLTEFLYIVFYCIAFIGTFLFSTFYHALTNASLKNTFRKIDQACIYFLIAATYLPLIYKYMSMGKGQLLMLLVWAFVPIGIISTWFYKSKYLALMVSVYLIQGLMFILFYNSFFASMPLIIKQMILIGVMFIITGIFFFLWRKWKYHHSIWHLFILCGNILIFLAIQKSLQI